MGEKPYGGKPRVFVWVKFRTFNLGDNRPTLEPVLGVEDRSITILTVRVLGLLHGVKLMIVVSFLFI